MLNQVKNTAIFLKFKCQWIEGIGQELSKFKCVVNK